MCTHVSPYSRKDATADDSIVIALSSERLPPGRELRQVEIERRLPRGKLPLSVEAETLRLCTPRTFNSRTLLNLNNRFNDDSDFVILICNMRNNTSWKTRAYVRVFCYEC